MRPLKEGGTFSDMPSSSVTGSSELLGKAQDMTSGCRGPKNVGDIFEKRYMLMSF